MQEAGLSVYPRLPGDMARSPQWPVSSECEHRWTRSCVVRAAENIALGSLVPELHLDAGRFNLPEATRMCSFATARIDAIKRELSRMNAGFATARLLRMRSASEPLARHCMEAV